MKFNLTSPSKPEKNEVLDVLPGFGRRAVVWLRRPGGIVLARAEGHDAWDLIRTRCQRVEITEVGARTATGTACYQAE